jgi:uncharacterized protein (DUF697 family)
MSTNRRKLPKAIRRTADDMRPVPPVHATEMNLLSEDGGAARLFGERGAVVEVASAPPRPVLRALARRASTPVEINAVRRLAQAQAIVERHATYSAAGGLIPLPIVNIASVTAIILRMVKMLSNLYGIPFEHDRARALVVGLVGGATPTGLATATASTLYFVMPASALIGLAVSSVTAVACTRSIGRIFVEHFEQGETLQDFSARR